jgi:hypothetical protein
MAEGARRKGVGGPKTAAGKARVRLNPVRHGVLSQTPVIPLVERFEDWEKLRLGVHEFFRVQGLAWPEALADRLAGLYWRCLRVQRFESESITSYLYDVPSDWRSVRVTAGLPVPEEVTPEAVAEMDVMLMSRLLPGDEVMDKVLRYETKLHRFLLQTEHQLLVLMGMARGPGVQWGTPDLTPPAMPAEGVRRPRVIKGTSTGSVRGSALRRTVSFDSGSASAQDMLRRAQDERDARGRSEE